MHFELTVNGIIWVVFEIKAVVQGNKWVEFGIERVVIEIKGIVQRNKWVVKVVLMQQHLRKAGR